MELAISAKGFERVFDSIAAGPRDPEATSAEPRELDAATDDAEIVGEIDSDEIEDDLPRIQRKRESESDEIVDVEIVNPDGYTEILNPAPTHRTPTILRLAGYSAPASDLWVSPAQRVRDS